MRFRFVPMRCTVPQNMVSRPTGNIRRAANKRHSGYRPKQRKRSLSWLRQILEWQQDMSDNKEFMSLLKSDLNLFSDTVFCFTPSGRCQEPAERVPHRSTLRTVSTRAVGNKMVGAKVNGKLVPHRLRDSER